MLEIWISTRSKKSSSLQRSWMALNSRGSRKPAAVQDVGGEELAPSRAPQYANRIFGSSRGQHFRFRNRKCMRRYKSLHVCRMDDRVHEQIQEQQ